MRYQQRFEREQVVKLETPHSAVADALSPFGYIHTQTFFQTSG